MTDHQTVVREYGDLVGHDFISASEADAVGRELNELGDRADFEVVVVEEWLLDEKAVDSIKSHYRVVTGRVERGRMRPEDVDRAHAAAILHDQRKAGREGGETASDHDLQMATGVREHVGDEVVARAVAAHMGPWYEGPEPASGVAELVHIADMVASDDNAILKIQGPVPEELRRLGFEGVDLHE